MGAKVTVDGFDCSVVDYRVNEEATPLTASDSSGSVGDFSVTITDPGRVYRLQGAKVTLDSDYNGVTSGFVRGVDHDEGDETYTLTCVGSLGTLNAYNVHCGPYDGTLSGAFRRYLRLAGVVNAKVDPTFDTKNVLIVGWYGEVWFHLKQLCAAYNAEIALVDDVITIRPVRSRVLDHYSVITRSNSKPSPSLAQRVEVVEYTNRRIRNDRVYPLNGWHPDVPIISATAGTTVRQVIELQASVSRIEQPVFTEGYSPSYRGRSAYIVCDESGRPVNTFEWSRSDGYVKVTVNPDTTSATVEFRAPNVFRGADGNLVKTLSLAVSHGDEGQERRAALTLRGDGIAFDKQTMPVFTGVPPRMTGTDVGETLDSPFVTDPKVLGDQLVRSASRYRGYVRTLQGRLADAVPDGGFQRGESTVGEVDAALRGLTVDQASRTPFPRISEPAEVVYTSVDDFFDYGNQIISNVTVNDYPAVRALSTDPGAYSTLDTREWVRVEPGDRLVVTADVTADQSTGVTVVSSVFTAEGSNVTIFGSSSVFVPPGGMATVTTGGTLPADRRWYRLRFRSNSAGVPLTVSNIRVVNETEERRRQAGEIPGTPTIDEVTEAWRNLKNDDPARQVFGTINGSRIWDETTKHWYRVSRSSISEGGYDFEAEIDTTVADHQEMFNGMTVAQVQNLYGAGATVDDVTERGLEWRI